MNPEPCSAFGINEGEKGNNAGPLHGIGEVALLLGSQAGHATGKDLAALSDEFFKKINVLVVDRIAGLDRGKTLFEKGAGHAEQALESEGLGKKKKWLQGSGTTR